MSRNFLTLHLVAISGKWSFFGPFFHPLTFLSIYKHCYLQSNEILFDFGIKRWNSRLNAWGLKICIPAVQLQNTTTVIGWRQSGKKKTRWNSDLVKFDANLSFQYLLKLNVLLTSLSFRNLTLFMTKQGILVLCFHYSAVIFLVFQVFCMGRTISMQGC
jgi:hypothetical protein